MYKDSLGIDTIGIGRNLEHRGISDYELDTMESSIEEIYENGITLANAYFLANIDIDIVENELCNTKPVVLDLDAVRQKVLMDMAFNLGIPRLCKFVKMWNAIESKDYKLASVEMLSSRWAEQVKTRAQILSRAMKDGEF